MSSSIISSPPRRAEPRGCKTSWFSGRPEVRLQHHRVLPGGPTKPHRGARKRRKHLGRRFYEHGTSERSRRVSAGSAEQTPRQAPGLETSLRAWPDPNITPSHSHKRLGGPDHMSELEPTHFTGWLRQKTTAGSTTIEPRRVSTGV